MNSKPIMQHYWTGTEWQERQRYQRRLHLVPAAAKPKPSLRQRMAAWWNANYEDVFNGCWQPICVIVAISFIALVVSQTAIRLGWLR